MAGEGAGSRVTSVVVASPDPLHDEFLPWDGLKLEVGDDNDGLLSPASSSQYSSCGESEFDKYCSANSILGTPSVCGSVGTFHDFHDSEFGSLGSFRSGDESGLEGFSLGGRLDLKFDDQRSSLMGGVDVYSRKNAQFDARRGLGKRRNAEVGHESRTTENGLSSPESGAASDLNTPTFGNYESGYNVRRDDSDLGVRQHLSMKESTLGRENGEAIKDHILKMEVGKVELSHSRLSIEQVNCGSGGLNFQLGLGNEGSDGERCSDEGETVSRCDHSNDEDSMYGCDTDDEKQIGLPYRGYGRHLQEVGTKNENPLRMTSSIAFGSDDWDDFMQETKEITSVSLVPDELMGKKQQRTETEGLDLKSTFTTTTDFQGINVDYEQEDVREMPVSNQVQVAHDLSVSSKTLARDHMKDQREFSNGFLFTTNKEEISNPLNTEDDLEIEWTPLTDEFNIMDDGLGGMQQQRSTKDSTSIDAAHPSESKGFGKTNSLVDSISHITDNIVCSTAKGTAENRKRQLFEDRKSHSLQPLTVNNTKTTQVSPASLSITDDHHGPKKTDSLELNEFYDEMVHDMEEILMDSSKSHAARFTPGKTIHPSQVLPPLRDGGSTASTSTMNDTAPLICHSLKIERIEVVGARQKKGDVSLGERLVGVKEYTVYKLRVWSGDSSWEVERRYRDFFTLYRRLKTLFSNQGWILPSPWLAVETESRKFFGNASPDVVAERSVLIQECLQSILHSRFSPSHLNALIWFLSPQKIGLSSPASDADVPPQTPIPISVGGIITESIYTRGQSISLIVEIRTSKSMRQMLEEQYYSCAGCHKHFDEGKTRMWELVQTLGWGKPRFCEYSGQLFCSSCHTNETAVLPARVLHQWDFARYPVSQLAKSYLDSIHDQPMLCVSAVNPFLFSRVPALQHVINVRKRIGGMLPYVRCPFRRSIYKELGSRRHILESNDFFALRDLIDLSKGVFAGELVIMDFLLFSFY